MWPWTATRLKDQLVHCVLSSVHWDSLRSLRSRPRCLPRCHVHCYDAGSWTHSALCCCSIHPLGCLWNSVSNTSILSYVHSASKKGLLKHAQREDFKPENSGGKRVCGALDRLSAMTKSTDNNTILAVLINFSKKKRSHGDTHVYSYFWLIVLDKQQQEKWK